MKKFDIGKWLPYIALIVVCCMFYFEKCSKDKNRSQSDTALINALGDSLRHYMNKDSNNVATISVIQTQSAKDFLAIQSKDAQINELQKVVKDYKNKLKQPGSSVTNVTTTTNVSGNHGTNVASRDTIRKDSFVYIYPEYSDSLMDAWIELKMKMNKDSSHFTLKVTDKYSVIIGEEGGLFKKKRPFVDVINYNPYSTIDAVRTYQVSTHLKKKRLGLGFSAGATVTPALKIQPYVGVGLNYNLIRF